MYEGGPRGIGRRVESPQERFRSELRSEVYRVLDETRDPLSHEVANKILEKLDIKDQIDKIQQFKDDTGIYQSWKQLGLFIVIDRTSKIAWNDRESGFMVNEGDAILDIHLPPIPEDRKTLSEVKRSMNLIAEYIVRHNLHPKYIMGVTFEKLARVSKRQGFTVIEPEIPADVRRGVENVYRRFSDKGINEQSMGKVLLCFQDTASFLRRQGVERYSK